MDDGISFPDRVHVCNQCILVQAFAQNYVILYHDHIDQ